MSSTVDDEGDTIGDIRSRVAFFEKAFSTSTLVESANKNKPQPGTPTQGIVKHTIERLTSPKRAKEEPSENSDPQRTDGVSPGKVKISVQLFSAPSSSSAAGSGPDQGIAAQPSAKKRRLADGAAEPTKEEDREAEAASAASRLKDAGSTPCSPFALSSPNEQACDDAASASASASNDQGDDSESGGSLLFPQDSADEDSFTKDDRSVANNTSVITDPNLSAVVERDDNEEGGRDDEGEAMDKVDATKGAPTPSASVRKKRALTEDFNRLCIRINVEPTEAADDAYSLKFKLRVVLNGLRNNLRRFAHDLPSEEGWEGVCPSVQNCFSGNDVILWLTFHALEAFKARENVPPGQPVSDRLSSLAHSTSLLIAERLIGLNVIKQVNDSQTAVEPLAQLVEEDSVFRFAAWAETKPLKTPTATPARSKLTVATAVALGERDMFSDALSPGGSGKKAPGSRPDVHLGRRSLVPETRSGKKRKQMEEGVGDIVESAYA